jgi:hypothetical protein
LTVTQFSADRSKLTSFWRAGILHRSIAVMGEIPLIYLLHCSLHIFKIRLMLWKYSCIELYIYKCKEVTPLNEVKILCHKKMRNQIMGLLELTWFILRG